MRDDWAARLLACEDFQWDEGNAPKIWEKHRVTPGEVEQAFLNQPLVAAPDPAHSSHEARFYALGRTDEGRGLFLVFTIRGRSLRVISARDMSRRERKEYERAEEAGEEEDSAL